MSAYVVVEFTVKDPEMYREKYAPIAGQTAKEHGGEVIAAGNWEVLHGDGSLTSGALVRFTDRETAIRGTTRLNISSWSMSEVSR
jgi:uncharacterized protein (DUF1330 family)